MRRVVADPGVLVSALISPTGAPAQLLIRAREGELELVVSERLLAELHGVLRRDKFRRYVNLGAVRDYVELLRRDALVAPDLEDPPPLRCADPDDDYLIALAHSENAVLVSGDKHLLDLADEAPVHSPAGFLD